MQPIADTGLLKALLDRNDPFHGWAAQVFPQHVPWTTCEPVLTDLVFATPPLHRRGGVFQLKPPLANHSLWSNLFYEFYWNH